MSTYHKIIGWLGLERTLRISPNPPALTRDIFPTSGCSKPQPGLEHSWGQGVSHQSHSEAFLIYNLNLPCQFKAITSYPIPTCPLRSSSAT